MDIQIEKNNQKTNKKYKFTHVYKKAIVHNNKYIYIY